MGYLGVQVSLVRPSIHVRQHLPWISCERNSSYSFVPIFLKLYMCFRHGMRIGMWFGYNCEISFCHFFHFVNSSHFSTTMFRQWVPCERNSSYNFIPIFLKHCIWFFHGLKMCIWFRYNPCFNLCHFLLFVNWVIFWPQILWKCIDSGYLVSSTPHTIFYWSFWNFALSMVLRFACVLDIIVELMFVTFFTLWTLSFSDLRF